MFDDNRNNRWTHKHFYCLMVRASARLSSIVHSMIEWILFFWAYCQGTGTGIHIDILNTTDSLSKIWSTNCMIMMMLGHQPKSTAIFERWHINIPKRAIDTEYCCFIDKLVDEKDDRTLFDHSIMCQCFHLIHVSPSPLSLETWHWLVQRKYLGFVSSMEHFTCSWHSHQSSIYSLSITLTHART